MLHGEIKADCSDLGRSQPGSNGTASMRAEKFVDLLTGERFIGPGKLEDRVGAQPPIAAIFVGVEFETAIPLNCKLLDVFVAPTSGILLMAGLISHAALVQNEGPVAATHEVVVSHSKRDSLLLSFRIGGRNYDGQHKEQTALARFVAFHADLPSKIQLLSPARSIGLTSQFHFQIA